jgi:hypothetical protein
MPTEREVLVSLLKLTTEGRVEIKEISRETRIPIEIVRQVLRKSLELGIVCLDRKLITAASEQRIRAAVRAVELGADIQRVCKFLTWAEFEDISVLAFDANNLVTKKHFRFSWSGRRWEIDILGLRKPIVACVDCKHWHRGWRGAASRRAAEQQIERTRVLAEASASMSKRLGIDGWGHACFVPAILSLASGSCKFYKGAPIVPVLQLRDFLQQMPAYLGKITHFDVAVPNI